MFSNEEVRPMKIDLRLVTGIFMGMVVALHYHGLLVAYLPVMMIVTLILVLKMVHR